MTYHIMSPLQIGTHSFIRTLGDFPNNRCYKRWIYIRMFCRNMLLQKSGRDSSVCALCTLVNFTTNRCYKIGIYIRMFCRNMFLQINVADSFISALYALVDFTTNRSYKIGMSYNYGYDGAAVMSGRFKGLRTLIMDKYPRAHFVLCVAHTLHLVLAHSIGNCIGTIKSIIHFFRQSALRDGLLKKTADEIGAPHSTLLSLCETRRSEKHTAVERFAEMYPVVAAALQQSGREVATQVYQLQGAMETGQFLVRTIVLRKSFWYTSNSARSLQNVNVDLSYTFNYEAKKLSSVDISVARMTGRQINRSNVPEDTAEVYYGRNIFYPFIEHVVNEIEARFIYHEETISEIQLVLHDRTQNTDRAKECITEIREICLNEAEKKIVVSEYELWCNQESPLQP
nr:unnamed protein product [Callosobruchus analis]